MAEFMRVLKANPYHDKNGLFTSKAKAAGALPDATKLTPGHTYSVYRNNPADGGFLQGHYEAGKNDTVATLKARVGRLSGGGFNLHVYSSPVPESA